MANGSRAMKDDGDGPLFTYLVRDYLDSPMRRTRAVESGMGNGSDQVKASSFRAVSSWATPMRRARRPGGARRAAIGRMRSNFSTARRVTVVDGRRSMVDGEKSSARGDKTETSFRSSARI